MLIRVDDGYVESSSIRVVRHVIQDEDTLDVGIEIETIDGSVYSCGALDPDEGVA